MKAILYFSTLFFIGTMLTSCGVSDANYEYENDFDKSYEAWLSFKETSGNSYRYKVPGGSWTGASWQTVITVTDGKVTQRSFKYTSEEGLSEDIPPEALEWTEDEDEINSHKHTGAAKALTLDQIYTKARIEWLTKRKNAKTYFEAENNGLISSCGYVEDNCADDCFIGINIEYIVPL